MTPFRLDGPLPDGLASLEASAGTGKTYAIAGLVARYVAVEAVRLPSLLVVTFTRAATAELRERVRRRLVDTAAHLDRVLAGGARETGDVVLDLCARGDGPELAARRRRLQVALAEFDAATIATIHGFCQHMLAGIGITSDVDRSATFIEDQRELVDACVDDVYLRAFREVRDLPLRRRELRAIAEKVVGNPEARLIPEGAAEEVVRWRVRLAHAVRDELDRRKRAAGLLSYDDLLTRLADALRDDRHGDAAARRLRATYDVALIDEFQDTDPIQWEILYRAFAAPGKTLVLIGDPKQAIYSFRGADVYAYVRAARVAGEAGTRTLDVNWRSDGPLVAACNTLFAGAALGHERIRYRNVRAAEAHEEPRLLGTAAAPLEVRVVRRDGAVRRTGGRDPLVVAGAARGFIARDVAAEIVDLLSSDAELIDRDGEGRERGRRPVAPGDLAVLVRTNAEAALVQSTLRDAHVPAVINGVGSVFATAAATEWLWLLEAIERPAAPDRARAAALTPFVGWSAAEIAEADDDALGPVHGTLHAWSALLRDRSVAALTRRMWVEQGVPERLLARDDGERLLTDLEHVGELLHAAASADQLGPTALAGWLRERVAESDEDLTSEERARRLESDADAVQVLTIHRAKGLEFPIVYCPYLWSSPFIDKQVPVFHGSDKRRAIDVGGKGREEFDEHVAQSEREQQGESLRLLYVAVTRARHRAVLWWAPCTGAWDSPLARLLFCRTARGVHTEGKPRLPDDDTTLERLAVLAEESDDTIRVSATPRDPRPAPWVSRGRQPAELSAATFDRALDHAWRRTSYSALIRVADARGVGSEPGEHVTDDEPDVAAPAAGDASGGVGGKPPHFDQPGGVGGKPAHSNQALRAHPCPLGALPGGTEFGTFVHGVLERVDFAAADLDGALEEAIAEQHGYRPADIGDADVLRDGLRRVVETPLGPLAGDVALRRIGRADRLDELAFELPLARAGAGLTLERVAALLRERLPADDPLAGYPDRLADPALRRVVRGYLTGSIDAVLRLPSQQFLVVDHKTNRLAPHEEAVTAYHYRPEALAAAMVSGHYPLQALLYAVALHRYLRWRLPGYEADTHLGGIAYLFVRGMTGPDVPRVAGQPCGVFAWAPPAGLVPALSDLLDAGEVGAA